jgi:hypothetical protein
MSLCFSGSRGEVEQRWILYALLRDNVRHHLENGVQTSEFQELHRAAQALGGGRVALNARRLRRELEKVQASLARRSIEDLAISAHTRAAINGVWPPDLETTAVVGRRAGAIGWVRTEARSLDQAFAPLIRRLLDLTEDADEEDEIEVTDV